MVKNYKIKLGKTTTALTLLLGITAILSATVFGVPPNITPGRAVAINVLKRAPDRFLVRFQPGTNAAQVANARGPINVSSQHDFSTVSGLKLFTIPPGQDLDTAIAHYKKNPNVLYVENDNIRDVTAAPNDTSFGNLWGLNNTGQTLNGTTGTADADMNVLDAWDNTGVTGSNSVVIAVIDTGVQYTHPDLTSNMWVNPGEVPGNGIDDDANGYVDDVYGINAITNTGNPMDDAGHGTHVAGTIAGVGNNAAGVSGVAQQAKILACKFLSGSGGGYDSDAIKCLDYIYALKQKGINIVATNNSWGGGGANQALSDAIDAQRSAGILFIAAAGNASSNNDAAPNYPSNYLKSNIIAVAATTQSDGIASFSNYGLRTVHVGAPGTNIYSTYPTSTYAFLQGTSMATPNVTGVVALVAAQDPSRDWKKIKNLILSSGTPIAALNGTTATGRRVRAWDTNGTGAMSCSNQTVSSIVYPQVASVTKISGTKLGLAALNINCANPAGTMTVTTSGPSAVGMVTLQDDGLGFDEIAGDGVYSGYWTAPATAGAYTLTFSNSQTLSVTVNALNSTMIPYRAPIAIAYNPRVGDPVYDPFWTLSDNCWIQYYSLPTFYYSNVAISSFYVTSKGIATLTAPGTAAYFTGANTALPNDTMTTTIAPYWDDLDLSAAGNGERLLVPYNATKAKYEIIEEWKGTQKSTGNPVQMQVVFTENSSDIEVHYIATDNSGASATAGMQVDMIQGTTQSVNTSTPDLAAGKAWLWRLDTGAPTANAGTTQNVNGNTLVTLNGSGTDPDGGVLKYNWAQTAGTVATLSNANIAGPTFYAPNVTGTLTFLLTVTDDANRSHSATVNINVTAVAAAGALQFQSTTPSVNENAGNASIVVDRVGGSAGAVAVTYATADGSAAAGSDYTFTSGTLNWADGDTASKTISIPITDDIVIEGNENLTFILSNATGGATISGTTATLTINDNDNAGVIAFSSSTYSVAENGTSVTITASRTGGVSGAVSANYTTANGTATAGSDYTAASGSLSWANGDSANKTFTVSITDDSVYEGSETVTLSLSNATGGATLGGNATLTITDNDPMPVPGTIAFSTTTYSVAENGVSATITATRTGGSDGAVGVSYATANGTATAGSDYTATSGTLSWANGDSANKTFTVTIADDSIYEGNETVSLSLSNNTGGATLGTSSATLTINEDDPAPAGNVSLSASTYTVAENGASVTITVSRTNGSNGAISVDYATSNGTAIAGAGGDYQAAVGTLNWANGDTANKTFSITILDDSLYEGSETVNIALANATGGAALGTINSAVLTITDNDPAPVYGTVALSATTYSVAENVATVTITATRSTGSNGAVGVSYATSNGTATAGSDYTAASGTLSWADGDATSKTFSVTILDDANYEGNETVNIAFSNVTGGASLGTSSAVLTILDNESAPASAGSLAFSATTYSVAENGATATVTVTRTNGSSGAVSVDYATADGTATTSGNDYTSASGTLTWADGDSASKTFTVTINDDSVYEGNETIGLSLSNAQGASLATAAATLTIVDDDAINHAPDVVELISPIDGATKVDGSLVTFKWNKVTDVDGDTVSYQLYYCDNAAFTGCTPTVVAKADIQTTLIAGLGGGSGIVLLGLVGVATRRQRIILIAVAMGLLFLSTGCGGNLPPGLGGGNGKNTVTTQVTGLTSGTQYYWKVVADDGRGKTSSSLIWTFTTK